MTTPLKDKIWQRVRTECAAEIQTIALDAFAHMADYSERSKRSQFPGQAQRRRLAIEHSDNGHMSPEQIDAHADELSKLRRIEENESAQRESARACNAGFFQLKPGVDALHRAVHASLQTQYGELIQAERDWLAGYGFNHEPTSISRSIEAERNAFNLVCDRFFNVLEALAKNPHSHAIPVLDMREFFGTLFAGDTDYAEAMVDLARQRLIASGKIPADFQPEPLEQIESTEGEVELVTAGLDAIEAQ